ncbi:MAG: S8 family serine peptidase, partial [Ferruginibacter sp.]
MKKIVVVTKKGIDPHKEGTMNFAKENMAFQLQLKKVYDQEEGIRAIKETEENPRLQELKDEMNRTFTIEVEEKNEAAVLRLLEEQGMFERIEADEKNFQNSNPNDPFFSSLYGIKKIQADAVWNSGNMGSEVLVAVVDSGIDVDHEDLKDNLWDDGNGNHGFNVINGSNNLTDISHHGTHVSGTIGAVVNNQKGVVGVAPKCRIMAIKGLDGPNGCGDATNLANGIKKAVDNGAKVINNSWGPGRSTDIHKAIEYAYLHGVVVVFAAGNDNNSVSASDAAGNPYVICVGATDSND